MAMPPEPSTRERITAMTMVAPADTAAYFSRERTTPGTSTPWEVAEQMVVSDTGARLSPKIAPEMMMPASRPG